MPGSPLATVHVLFVHGWLLRNYCLPVWPLAQQLTPLSLCEGSSNAGQLLGYAF
jgi:hypothetical protein